MVHLADRSAEPTYRVNEIHDEDGFRRIASLLAEQYDPAHIAPMIDVADVDLFGNRALKLVHESLRGARLDAELARKTLLYAETLWGYRVHLQERDSETGRVLAEHASS
jgi:stage V sporulation protein R